MPRHMNHLWKVLFEEPTGNVRFFFGLITIGYAAVMPGFAHHPMYSIAFGQISPWTWSLILGVNGAAILYGALTNKPSRLMYLLEGWLGAGAWFLLGMATTIAQGMPGPTFFAMFVAIWIFVRYPEWR